MKKGKKVKMIETEKDTKEGLRRQVQNLAEDLEGVAASLATEKASVKELQQEVFQLKDVSNELARDLERAVNLSTQRTADLAAAQKALEDYQKVAERKIREDALIKRAEIGTLERALEIAVTAGRSGGDVTTMLVSKEGLPEAIKNFLGHCVAG